MHQTVGNVLRTLLLGQPPQQITGARAKEFIDEALAITNARNMRWNTLHVGKQPREFSLQ